MIILLDTLEENKKYDSQYSIQLHIKNPLPSLKLTFSHRKDGIPRGKVLVFQPSILQVGTVAVSFREGKCSPSFNTKAAAKVQKCLAIAKTPQGTLPSKMVPHHPSEHSPVRHSVILSGREHYQTNSMCYKVPLR